MLFLFLGLPGVIIAALLAGVIASSGRERRRREQALLRVRGASPTRIVRLAWAEAILVAVAGTLVGLIAAAIVGRIAFGTADFGATTGQALAWVGASVVFGWHCRPRRSSCPHGATCACSVSTTRKPPSRPVSAGAPCGRWHTSM